MTKSVEQPPSQPAQPAEPLKPCQMSFMEYKEFIKSRGPEKQSIQAFEAQPSGLVSLPKIVHLADQGNVQTLDLDHPMI